MIKNLKTKLENNILFITINREDKMNALNIELLAELKNIMEEIYENQEVKGVIITGSGNKSFAAGADIAEFSNFTVRQGKEMSQNGHRIFNLIENCTKPVIAAVNGFALGGGCELAMACHIRVAADNAKFGQPEVNLGIIPGYGGTQRLVQLIGKGKALELLVTADMINANDALQWGLVNHVVPQENLIPKCKEILQKIFSKSPLNIKQIIHLVNAHFSKTVNAMDIEMDEFGDCFGAEDFKEGTTAFLEKRKPNFSGK